MVFLSSPQLRLQVLPFEVEIVLTAYWTFFAVFHPPEYTAGMESVSALQHILLCRYSHLLQTDRTRELLVVYDGLSTVFLPNRVYQVFVTFTLSATVTATFHHPHDLASASTLFTFNLLFIHIFVYHTSLRFTLLILRIRLSLLLPLFDPFF